MKIATNSSQILTLDNAFLNTSVICNLQEYIQFLYYLLLQHYEQI